MPVHQRHVQVTSPCPLTLADQGGRDGATRWHCGHCDKSVHVLSNMTEREARTLLRDNVGRDLCVSYAVSGDGSIRFRPEPTPALIPARALTRRRAAALAAVGLGAALAACTPHHAPDVGTRAIEQSTLDVMDATPTIPEQTPSEHVPPEPTLEPEALQVVGGGVRAMPPPPRPGGLTVRPLPQPPPMPRPSGGLVAEPLPSPADEPCDPASGAAG